jgi:hypothetical protein
MPILAPESICSLEAGLLATVSVSDPDAIEPSGVRLVFLRCTGLARATCA